MPKYWGKQIFTHRRFLEVGQKQKMERKKDGNNNGQATHGARKHAWCTQARMAHASRLGQNMLFKALPSKHFNFSYKSH